MNTGEWIEFAKAHVWKDSNDGKWWFGGNRYRREGQAVKACWKEFKRLGVLGETK